LYEVNVGILRGATIMTRRQQQHLNLELKWFWPNLNALGSHNPFKADGQALIMKVLIVVLVKNRLSKCFCCPDAHLIQVSARFSADLTLDEIVVTTLTSRISDCALAKP
jgi:hypothetical protein